VRVLTSRLIWPEYRKEKTNTLCMSIIYTSSIAEVYTILEDKYNIKKDKAIPVMIIIIKID
jgi:hypothetical protein